MDIIHQKTRGLHYEGPGAKYRQIIIDAAEIAPGRFEVMAMTTSGKDFDCITVGTVEEAATVYRDMVSRHTKQPEKPEAAEAVKPLTGKYAQLRDDLKKGLEAAKIAVEANPEDGGTCNFDSPMLLLPRWKESLVQQAAAEAGTHCFAHKMFSEKMYVFSARAGGQGNSRTRAAEAMCDSLKKAGYEAYMYYQMD